MRLFSALLPPPDALDALTAAVAEAGFAEVPGWRPVPRERLHVTLAFHGDDDPARRARDLDERLAGAVAPVLRLAGTGSFPGVLWAGVRTAGPGDAAALARLVEAAGADPETFTGHLTLARRDGRQRSARPSGAQIPPGPWWSPAEVLLMSSTRTPAGLRYAPVHRTPLIPGRTSQALP